MKKSVYKQIYTCELYYVNIVCVLMCGTLGIAISDGIL